MRPKSRNVVLAGVVFLGFVLSVAWETRHSGTQGHANLPPAPRELEVTVSGRVEPPVAQVRLILHFPELPCDLTLDGLAAGDFRRKVALQTNAGSSGATFVQVEARSPGYEPIRLKKIPLDPSMSIRIPVLQFVVERHHPPLVRVRTPTTHSHGHGRLE